MNARRPGAPRRAGRPVAASGGRTGSRATGRQTSAGAPGRSATSRPGRAARPRTTAAAAPSTEQDGPVWGITRRALVLIALIVIALATLVPTLNRYVSQRQELQAAQEQVADRQSEVDALQRDVDRWEDPTYVAGQARERLLYAMPGETQYRLTDTSGKDVPLTEEERSAEEAAKKDWYDTLWTSVQASSRLRPEDVPVGTTTEEPAPDQGTTDDTPAPTDPAASTAPAQEDTTP